MTKLAQFDQYQFTWAEKNMSPSGHGLGIVGASNNDFAHIEEICRNIYNSVRRDGVPSRQLIYSPKNRTFVIANVAEALNSQSPRPTELYHLYEYKSAGKPIAECPPEEYLCPDTFTNSYYGENQELQVAELFSYLPSAAELLQKHGINDPNSLAFFLDKIYKVAFDRVTGFIIVGEGVSTANLSDYACEMAVIIHSLIPPSAKSRATFISNSSGQQLQAFAYNFCNRAMPTSDFMYNSKDRSALYEDSPRHALAIFMANAFFSDPELFASCSAELDRVINSSKQSQDETLRVSLEFMGMHPEVKLASHAAYKSFKEMHSFFLMQPEFDTLAAQAGFVSLASCIDDTKALSELAQLVAQNADTSYAKARLFELIARIAESDAQSAGELLENSTDASLPIEAFYYFANTDREGLFPMADAPLTDAKNLSELEAMFANPTFHQNLEGYAKRAAELSWADPNFTSKSNYHSFATEHGVFDIFEGHSRALAHKALASINPNNSLSAIRSVVLKLPVTFGKESSLNLELWNMAALNSEDDLDNPLLAEIAELLSRKSEYSDMRLGIFAQQVSSALTIDKVSEIVSGGNWQGDSNALPFVEAFIVDRIDEIDMNKAVQLLSLFPSSDKLLGELQAKLKAKEAVYTFRTQGANRFFGNAVQGSEIVAYAHREIASDAERYFDFCFRENEGIDAAKAQSWLEQVKEAFGGHKENELAFHESLKAFFEYFVASSGGKKALGRIKLITNVEFNIAASVLKQRPNDDECRMLLVHFANLHCIINSRIATWKTMQAYCTLNGGGDPLLLCEFVEESEIMLIPEKVGAIAEGTVNSDYFAVAFISYFLDNSERFEETFGKLSSAASDEAMRKALLLMLEGILPSQATQNIMQSKREGFARLFHEPGMLDIIRQAEANMHARGIASIVPYLQSFDASLAERYIAHTASKASPKPEGGRKARLGSASASDIWFMPIAGGFAPAVAAAAIYKVIAAFSTTKVFFGAMLAAITVSFIITAINLRRRNTGAEIGSSLKISATALMCVLFMIVMYVIDSLLAFAGIA